MDAFGSISAFPVRHYLAATGLQSKGLDQLVKDPGAALRRLGELSVNEQTRATERAEKVPAIPVAADRSVAGRLMQQSLEEARTSTSSDGAEGAREDSRLNTASTEKGAVNPVPAKSNEGPVGQLTPEEQQAVDELSARDREVRAHEQAHKNVGGRYAGAISYVYQKGPNGQQYAIGGSVPIDVSPEATPEATVAKMRVVIAAALAPAEPSPADRAVAQTAQGQLMQASADARIEQQAEMQARLESDRGDVAAVAPIDGQMEEAGSNLANFLAVENQDSPYNILGVIERHAA